jgi:outer membrane protein TolC
VPAPAELVERLPDFRAAEARLQATGGDVAAARRVFHPSFGLSLGAVARNGGMSAPNPLVATIAHFALTA